MLRPEDPGDLQAAFLEADHVLVVSGHEFDPGHRDRNVVLADARGQHLASLAEALALDGGERMAWMMLGNPSLVFMSGRLPVALIQYLEAGYLRSPEIWEGDVPLRDPSALERWFDAVGTNRASR